MPGPFFCENFQTEQLKILSRTDKRLLFKTQKSDLFLKKRCNKIAICFWSKSYCVREKESL